MTLVLFFGGEVDPPSEPPPPTPGEEGGGGVPLVQTSFFWQEVYRDLTPLTYAEEEQDYALRNFVKALSLPFELIHYLVRDDADTGKVGWSALLDPVRCPDELLPWFAQFVGVTAVKGEPYNSLRARINTAAFDRGTPQSLKDTAARLGITSMQLTERYEGNPWKVLLTFDPAEYTGAKAYEIVRKIPAGIVVVIDFGDGVTYSDIRETYADYAAAEAANLDYTDLRGG